MEKLGYTIILSSTSRVLLRIETPPEAMYLKRQRSRVLNGSITGRVMPSLHRESTNCLIYDKITIIKSM